MTYPVIFETRLDSQFVQPASCEFEVLAVRPEANVHHGYVAIVVPRRRSWVITESGEERDRRRAGKQEDRWLLAPRHGTGRRKSEHVLVPLERAGHIGYGKRNVVDLLQREHELMMPKVSEPRARASLLALGLGLRRIHDPSDDRGVDLEGPGYRATREQAGRI